MAPQLLPRLFHFPNSDNHPCPPPSPFTPSLTTYRLAFTGVNVTFTCGTIAIAKALLHPSNFNRKEVVDETAKVLPSWYESQYKQRRMGQVWGLGWGGGAGWARLGVCDSWPGCVIATYK